MSVRAILETSHRPHTFTIKSNARVTEGAVSPNLESSGAQVIAQTKELSHPLVTIFEVEHRELPLEQRGYIGTGDNSFVHSTPDGHRVTTNGAGSGRVQQVTAETPVTTPLFRRVAALNNARSAQQANEAARNPGNRVNGM